ncbi:MAG TPA: NUDIX hydrolase [Planctomycetota bacterium]|jgi:ADP-ribose pyrophosphatase
MAGRFRIIKQRTVLKSRVFTVREETWRAPNGSTFDRHTIQHPGAVAIVPFDSDGRVLMIRQFRPAANTWLLEIPAGTLERREKPLACAKRELIEETGFRARKWQRMGAIYTAPGFCSERIHLFRAWDLKAAFAEKDEDEHIELAAMTLPEIHRAIRSGRICDGKTLSAMMLLHLMNLESGGSLESRV